MSDKSMWLCVKRFVIELPVSCNVERLCPSRCEENRAGCEDQRKADPVVVRPVSHGDVAAFLGGRVVVAGDTVRVETKLTVRWRIQCD